MFNTAFTNKQALEAARCLRPLLSSLLTHEQAQEIDIQLAQPLNDSSLEESAKVDTLLEIICDNPQTKAWLEEYLSETSRGFSIGSDPSLLSARKYICPVENDYTTFLENNREIPICPTHLVALIPAKD